MTTYPALIPSSRVFTPGEYPATAFSGYSGAQGRVRHSNVFLAAQLRLSYIGLSEAQMLQVWNHFTGQQGNYEAFTLPVEVLSGSDITDYVPATYQWIYSGPGQVEDLPCGGHNVSLSLETVPPVPASVAGASLRLRLSLEAGEAVESANGINEAITFSLEGGEAIGDVEVDGINESITFSLEAGAAIGDVNMDGIDEAITLALEAGQAIGDVNMDGIDEAITFSLEAGDAFNLLDGINEAITFSLVTGAASSEPEIGDAYGGGYFAGYISHTADGVATHRLIVAPADTGATGNGYTLTTNLRYKTSQTATSGTGSSFDGVANTDAIVAAGIANHPAAEFCTQLAIGGFNDWYLPAKDELDIAYQNLKPTTASNSTSFGVNDYSVPKRTSNRTSSEPGQTSITDFQGAEAFNNSFHWSSTTTATASAQVLSFSNGAVSVAAKNETRRVRAFRREAI
jgi:hypothetical protein